MTTPTNPALHFLVSCDHVDARWQRDSLPVVVGIDRQGDGQPDRYYVSIPGFGCSKSYSTPRAAIVGMLQDHACFGIVTVEQDRDAVLDAEHERAVADVKRTREERAIRYILVVGNYVYAAYGEKRKAIRAAKIIAATWGEARRRITLADTWTKESVFGLVANPRPVVAIAEPAEAPALEAAAPDLSDWNFGDDLDLNAPDVQAEMRRNAHVANGGERTTAMVDCVKCGGSGSVTIGYRNPSPRQCFRCSGKGKISVRSAAASKGAQTARENLREKQARTYGSPEWAYISRRAERGSAFYAGLVGKVEAYGELTENQLASVRRDIAADEAKRAERDAGRPAIDSAAIQALFDRAAPRMAKLPIFRTTAITIKQAPATGKNPGALYVKATVSGDYLGKIVAGRWHAKHGAPDVTAALQAVAIDPTAAAIAYAREFKRCACCGTTLRNPVSVGAVVGPICAENWGLEHLRIAAAEIIAAEAAQDAAGE